MTKTPSDEEVCEEMRETEECGHNACHNYCRGCMTLLPRDAGDTLCHQCAAECRR